MSFSTMATVLLGSSSPDRESHVLIEEADVLTKVTQNVPSGIYGLEQHANYKQQQQGLSNMFSVNSEIVNQVPQLEYVVHNIVMDIKWSSVREDKGASHSYEDDEIKDANWIIQKWEKMQLERRLKLINGAIVLGA